MPQLDSLVGKTIGKYSVEREVGRGGMGVVYKARDASLGREVALKVLHGHLTADAGFVKRFEREARAAAQLSHPNIVEVHAVGVDDGRPFIAMEYVTGRPLTEVIQHAGQLDVKRALDIARQAAEAFAEAHRQGIIHRDIKPQNLMVDSRGQVKVLDFGLAKALQDQTALTADGAKLGTPMYMSPEQCQGQELDRRTDVYSLGVTLYEMLAGCTPYASDTPALALMYQIAREPFPDVRSVNPRVPSAVAALIARMTAKDRTKRHGSAGLLCAHLEALARGETPDTLLAEAEGSTQPARRTPQRTSRMVLGKPLGFWLQAVGTILMCVMWLIYEPGGEDRNLRPIVFMGLGYVLVGAGFVLLSNKRFIQANELPYLSAAATCLSMLLAWAFGLLQCFASYRGFLEGMGVACDVAVFLLTYATLFLLGHRINGVASLRKDALVHIPVALLAGLLAVCAIGLAAMEEWDAAGLVVFPALLLIAATILYGLFRKGGGPLAITLVAIGAALQLASLILAPVRERLAVGFAISSFGVLHLALWVLFTRRWEEAFKERGHVVLTPLPNEQAVDSERTTPASQVRSEEGPRGPQPQAPHGMGDAESVPLGAAAAGSWRNRSFGFWIGALGVCWGMVWFSVQDSPFSPTAHSFALGAVAPAAMLLGVIMIGGRHLFMTRPLPYGFAQAAFLLLTARSVSLAVADAGTRDIKTLSVLLALVCLWTCVWMLAHRIYGFSSFHRGTVAHVILIGGLVLLFLFIVNLEFAGDLARWRQVAPLCARLAVVMTFLVSVVIGMRRTRTSETFSFLVVVGVLLQFWPFLASAFLENGTHETLLIRPFGYGMACQITAILLALDQAREESAVRDGRSRDPWSAVRAAILAVFPGADLRK